MSLYSLPFTVDSVRSFAPVTPCHAVRMSHSFICAVLLCCDEVFRPTPDHPSRLSPPPRTPRILPCADTQTQAIPDHGQHLVATRPVLEWIA